ncbi:UxaA family hydrolase [Bacillus sp. V2I10]|uniref:UxaA family hydrolase n=1 Tax=Bacillus sp. V2I10 TaxID=3042276 RepID=UPI002782BF90|nr:UxaA family hydrolase [Bacillus sp. V2I10]MDQ0857184.1 altronate dehydratase small subunit [Bacillus sp. V2I10]
MDSINQLMGSQISCIVMNKNDNVITLLKRAEKNELLTFSMDIDGHPQTLRARQAAPFGHKLALRKIKEGEEIIKYGEVIGRATADIEDGEHVHVHNLIGIRGRGDQSNLKENSNGSH